MRGKPCSTKSLFMTAVQSCNGVHMLLNASASMFGSALFSHPDAQAGKACSEVQASRASSERLPSQTSVTPHKWAPTTDGHVRSAGHVSGHTADLEWQASDAMDLFTGHVPAKVQVHGQVGRHELAHDALAGQQLLGHVCVQLQLPGRKPLPHAAKCTKLHQTST